jgi:hypothetical protein
MLILLWSSANTPVFMQSTDDADLNGFYFLIDGFSQKYQNNPAYQRSSVISASVRQTLLVGCQFLFGEVKGFRKA